MVNSPLNNIIAHMILPLVQEQTCVIVSVQFSCSVVSNSATPWTAARQASLSITNFRSLLKLMSIKSVIPSSHLILCHPLLFPPSIFPSIRVFSNESVLRIRWPKYWSFSFSNVLPMNSQDRFPLGCTGWISLKSKELKSLLQHHSSKTSILWCPAFSMVQLSHPYMTTGRTPALTGRTFVGNVSAFNMLSRLVQLSFPGAGVFESHGCPKAVLLFLGCPSLP